MVTFFMNCFETLGGVGVIAILLCNIDFLKMYLLFNYIEVEIKS